MQIGTPPAAKTDPWVWILVISIVIITIVLITVVWIKRPKGTSKMIKRNSRKKPMECTKASWIAPAAVLTGLVSYNFWPEPQLEKTSWFSFGSESKTDTPEPATSGAHDTATNLEAEPDLADQPDSSFELPGFVSWRNLGYVAGFSVICYAVTCAWQCFQARWRSSSKPKRRRYSQKSRPTKREPAPVTATGWSLLPRYFPPTQKPKRSNRRTVTGDSVPKPVGCRTVSNDSGNLDSVSETLRVEVNERVNVSKLKKFSREFRRDKTRRAKHIANARYSLGYGKYGKSPVKRNTGPSD